MSSKKSAASNDEILVLGHFSSRCPGGGIEERKMDLGDPVDRTTLADRNI
jgi:hypothetical protein